MKEPNEKSTPTEFDVWRENREMRRLRRNIIGIEDYGWDGEALRRNENF